MGPHPEGEDAFARLLSGNSTWCAHTHQHDPSLFPTLAKGQHPKVLWLGCSDSRVPETTITGLKPGDIFVHRNIANILHPGDLSAASVIEYAVAHVGVQHVVLCGHTSCGGVNAALGNSKIGVIDAWLLPLRALRARGKKTLEGLGEKERVQWLVEENVREGVRVLRGNSNVIEAAKGRGLTVHGVVYDIEKGTLKEVECPCAEGEMEAIEWAFETGKGGH
ncbi:hypothetical protein MMC30_007354 [Trapelia coarctata]|nr:hypothetical protein [Trapelia coarctata]